MTTEPLALLGGPKTITAPFSRHNPIGAEEVEAARRVVESGVLSRFLGCWAPDFYGGPKVQEFERAFSGYIGCRHALAVNSCTAALHLAVLGWISAAFQRP